MALSHRRQSRMSGSYAASVAERKRVEATPTIAATMRKTKHFWLVDVVAVAAGGAVCLWSGWDYCDGTRERTIGVMGNYCCCCYCAEDGYFEGVGLQQQTTWTE